MMHIATDITKIPSSVGATMTDKAGRSIGIIMATAVEAQSTDALLASMSTPFVGTDVMAKG
jgi:hypothetical protein